MTGEYRLTIQATGNSRDEAIESAIRMLNEGATFDMVTDMNDSPEPADLFSRNQ